jgi:hypothetical protein
MGARVIEKMEPVVTTNNTNDRLVLLRYRRQDSNTTVTAGTLMCIRPSDSFSVIFSFDEKSGSELLLINAVNSIRKR